MVQINKLYDLSFEVVNLKKLLFTRFCGFNFEDRPKLINPMFAFIIKSLPLPIPITSCYFLTMQRIFREGEKQCKSKEPFSLR